MKFRKELDHFIKHHESTKNVNTMKSVIILRVVERCLSNGNIEILNGLAAEALTLSLKMVVTKHTNLEE